MEKNQFFKVLKNSVLVVKTPRTRVRTQIIPDNAWGIYYVSDNHQIKICDIMNYVKNPQGVAEGIVKVLNEQNTYILPIT